MFGTGLKIGQILLFSQTSIQGLFLNPNRMYKTKISMGNVVKNKIGSKMMCTMFIIRKGKETS